jgi:hypothetical protein
LVYKEPEKTDKCHLKKSINKLSHFGSAITVFHLSLYKRICNMFFAF